jgi:hypothetical protein
MRGAERQANRHTGGLGTRDCPLRVGDIDGFIQRTGEDHALQWGHPEEER